MKIIIIEDELPTAKELKSILEKLDEGITITATLTSVASAIKWLETHQSPDLIFSDIQLGDGLSFEIFRQLQVSAPVIFCTAYDQYAIKAFDANGIDYLLKPLNTAMVEKGLNKYRRVKAHLTGDAIMTRLDKAMSLLDPTYKQSILVHFREKIIPIKTADIQYAYASNGKVLLHQIDNQDYLAHYTIDQMEQSLNPKTFYRANRQYLINRDIIQNIEHYFNRRLMVKTSCATPEKIIISRERSQDFLRWVEQ